MMGRDMKVDIGDFEHMSRSELAERYASVLGSKPPGLGVRRSPTSLLRFHNVANEVQDC